MSNPNTEIYRWLSELEKIEAATFFKNYCEFDYTFSDLAYGLDGSETIIVLVTVTVQLKQYKMLGQLGEIAQEIEECINEYCQSQNMHAISFSWRPTLPAESSISSLQELQSAFSEEYIKKQVQVMVESIKENPHLALGTAKELIESCCKYILRKAGIQYEVDWDMPKLVKESNKALFEKFEMKDGATSIRKILTGFTTVVQGLTELRNEFGSGHGHDPEFEPLDELHTKFIVSMTGEIVVFWRKLADSSVLRQT